MQRRWRISAWLDGSGCAVSSETVRAVTLICALAAVAGCDVVSGLSDFDVVSPQGNIGGAGGEGAGGEAGSGGQGGAAAPLPCVVQMATRRHSTCVVLRDASLWCWGENGGLGTGSVMASNTPVHAADDVKQVGLGRDFIVVLHTDGTVQAWGENDRGQLGLGTTGSRLLEPQTVPINDVAEVAVGRAHTCVRTTEGTVGCWGANDVGQVGRSPTDTPVASTPQSVAVNASRIVAGSLHTCVIRSIDSVVACWGKNLDGQLGRPPSPFAIDPEPLVLAADDIALGGGHTCVVRDGNVSCFGGNNSWQLGDGAAASHQPRQVNFDGEVVQVMASGRRSCGRVETGAVWCWGDAGLSLPMGQPVDRQLPATVSELEGVGAIGLASHHLCALRPNDTVWCRGRGLEGQLGNGFDMDSESLFVEAQLSCPPPP